MDISKLTSWYFNRRALPYWLVLLFDCLVIVVSGLLSLYVCTSGEYLANHFWRYALLWSCALPFFFAGMRLLCTYTGVLRYSSFVDLGRIFISLMIGFALLNLCAFLMPHNWLAIHIPFKLQVITLLVALIGEWSLRILAKFLYDTALSSDSMQGAFIYGVKEGGVSLAKSIRNQEPRRYSLCGFVSPEGDLDTKYLMGVKVRSDGPNLIKHMKDARAKVLLVSPLQSKRFRERTELINNLTSSGIKILMMPAAEEWDGESDLTHHQLHEVEIEDLLPRDEIRVDMDAIGAMLAGKRVLITGAAGSIGSEMVRQVAVYKPAELILIDQAETPMHDVRLMMARQFSDVKNETIVGSIADKVHMEKIFAEHKPEYVFHAAAYKHVPMMEDNPAMAVRNNINGTRVIADLAVKYGIKKFVMISTDKAVNPTNVMGCSKRICEIYCQSLNQAIVEGKVEGETQFVTTRFGNVLGSNGSVIPIFREQIKKGGPVTVTHPDIIRFFMLIPEACKLVLEAGTMGKGGEIFVFDMGKPVKIVDLANRMISLSGAKGVEIKFTGLRDGEKLFEEVLNDKEGTKPTHHPKIMIAQVRSYDYEVAKKNEDDLLELSFTHDDMAIVKKMKEIVPEYKSRVSKYEILDK